MAILVLSRSVQYCSVQYCSTVLSNSILFSSVQSSTVPSSTVLSSTVLYSTVLSSIVISSSILSSTLPSSTVLSCTVLSPYKQSLSMAVRVSSHARLLGARCRHSYAEVPRQCEADMSGKSVSHQEETGKLETRGPARYRLYI